MKKDTNQFSHKFVWDNNGVGKIVVKLNDNIDKKNTNTNEKINCK